MTAKNIAASMGESVAIEVRRELEGEPMPDAGSVGVGVISGGPRCEPTPRPLVPRLVPKQAATTVANRDLAP
jgi:hypothetical protein